MNRLPIALLLLTACDASGMGGMSSPDSGRGGALGIFIDAGMGGSSQAQGGSAQQADAMLGMGGAVSTGSTDAGASVGGNGGAIQVGGSGGSIGIGGAGGMAGSQPSVNLVRNPGFEDGTNNWVNVGGGNGQVSQGDAHSGQSALHESAIDGIWRQRLSPVPTGPATYTLSAWGKGPSMKCAIRIAVSDQGVTSSKTSDAFDVSWSMRQVTFIVPQSAQMVEILAINNQGTNGCSFDDFDLR